MFRKVEIWVLYLVVLIGILFAIGFGVLVRQEIVGDTKLGKIDISLLSRPAAYIAGLPEQTLKLILKPNPNRINDPWDEERFFYTQNGFVGTPNSNKSYLLLSRYDGDLNDGIVDEIKMPIIPITIMISMRLRPDWVSFCGLIYGIFCSYC